MRDDLEILRVIIILPLVIFLIGVIFAIRVIIIAVNFLSKDES